METINNERTTKIEQLFKACIVAARTIAIPVALFGFLSLSQTGHGINWRVVLKWKAICEIVTLITFFGYAFFIILPIENLSSGKFWILVSVGTILAVGSTWFSKIIFTGFTVDLFQGELIFRSILWLLLAPVYLYIPILILRRRLQRTRNTCTTEEQEI